MNEILNNSIDNVTEKSIKSKNTDNAIYFNFSYSALKLLGKNLYSNAANAISELVANALDANASNIYVYIDMSDKSNSIIEIIDNGTGMSYSDLAEKYVWIGRNKRNDTDLTAEEKKTVMGRKGIGKLAALYLSNKYYILTKKRNNSEVNQWKINLSAYDESDFPKMDRVINHIDLVNEDIWRKNTHGTAIKLENVDLRRNGTQRIEGLKRLFADFYLLDSLKATIYVAVKTKPNEEVYFEKVEKKIAYKNFYALFDNSGLEISKKILDSIAFTWASPYPHIADKERNTIVLNNDEFSTSGSAEFESDDGTLIKKDYRLSGWIGVHSTIDPKNAIDKNFIRNSVYQPNRLRLYVRNKLAVSDYFMISPNTQAMANYIEGEITFNILDDDDLPDIATSSRQDFLDDKRIELLIEIVDPILKALFSVRNKIGKNISDENTLYANHLVEREKEEKKKAEKEKEEAEKAKVEAEVKYDHAKAEAKKYHAQSHTIFNTVTEDQYSFSAKTHLVKTNALTIRNGVKLLAKKIGFDKYKELSTISVATDKILSALKYSTLANFNIENEYINEDLFIFINEYLHNILERQYFEIKINTRIDGSYNVRFNPQYITLLLDNIVSNSEKSSSTEINFEMINKERTIKIIITDNGRGFADSDMDRIFEFGFSNTGGTGIGLYNVKTVVEKMKGEIIATKPKECGARFEITFHERG